MKRIQFNVGRDTLRIINDMHREMPGITDKYLGYALLRALGYSNTVSLLDSDPTIPATGSWTEINLRTIKIEKTTSYRRVKEWLEQHLDEYDLTRYAWTNDRAVDVVRDLLEISIHQVKRMGAVNKPLADSVIGCVKLLNDMAPDETTGDVVQFFGGDEV